MIPVPWTEKRKVIAAGLRGLAARIECREKEEMEMKEYGKIVNGLLGVIAERDAQIKTLTAASPDADDAAAMVAAEKFLAANPLPASGSNSTGT